MHCVNCDNDTDYNRIAVDRSSGEITGTICVRCEEDIVLRRNDSSVLTMATCVLCDGPSDILFPKWDSIVETEDGRNKIEYTIELTTLSLCEECLAANRLSPLVQPAEGAEID